MKGKVKQKAKNESFCVSRTGFEEQELQDDEISFLDLTQEEEIEVNCFLMSYPTHFTGHC